MKNKKVNKITKPKNMDSALLDKLDKFSLSYTLRKEPTNCENNEYLHVVIKMENLNKLLDLLKMLIRDINKIKVEAK